MSHGVCNQHIAKNAEGGDAPKESEHYPNAAEEFGADGQECKRRRDVHLLGEERQVYRNGFRFVNVEAEWGRFGLMIGSDLAFPEVARSLTLEGAEMVVVSANWETQWAEAWRAHLLSRACENSIFVAAANRIGEEPTMRFSGDSMLVGPSAEVYTVLDEPIEGYAIATIDLDQVRKVREDRQLIQYREPIAYRAIVKKY